MSGEDSEGTRRVRKGDDECIDQEKVSYKRSSTDLYSSTRPDRDMIEDMYGKGKGFVTSPPPQEEGKRCL